MLFEDRKDAGRKLAQALISYRNRDVVVYALPRGGVVIGAEVARVLDAPLDLVIARKIGHPSLPECAIAAVTEDGHIVTSPEEELRLDRRWFEQEVRIQQKEANRRRQVYVQGREPLPVIGRIAIIVDDGVATALTMFAAIQQLRQRYPARIVVAVPVAHPAAVRKLKLLADEVIALHTPESFMAVGRYYVQFDQVSDAEVIDLMSYPELRELSGPGRRA